MTEHGQELLDRAGHFLRADPARNTIILTECERLARATASSPQPRPLLGWWQGDGEDVSGVFIHTPPYPLHFSALAEHALAPLAELLAGRGRDLFGVNAGDAPARAFAAQWRRRCGAEARVGMRTRLYRLAELQVPQHPPPGHAAAGSVDDRDLLVLWTDAFGVELGGFRADVASHVDERLARGAYTIWRDESGAPVSLAGLSVEVGGARRIGPVYTPEHHRRRGFGAAVTAAACRRALDGGTAELLLFADVANPTSNRLYERLGFEPLEELVVLRFEHPE